MSPAPILLLPHCRPGLVLAAALALAALPGTRLGAQTWSVQRIGPPSGGASSLIPTGLNEQGHVVGWSQFFGSAPTLRSWIWTPQAGLTYLTPPPGQSLLRAMDVNDSDVIAGDGGYDTGVAWRYHDGVFDLLGVLPGGDTVSTAGGINALGVIAGASRNGSSILVPPSAFVATPAQPLLEIFATGTGTAINDAGQVVGYSAVNKAFRYTPGEGVQILGSVGTHDLNFAWAINAAGDVVGEAVESNSVHYEPIPFLYTAAGGMQEIGDFGGYSVAVSVNDARQVVGTYDPPNLPPAAWLWSAETGVKFLQSLVAPAEHLNLLKAARINDAGQILAEATDNQTGDHFVVILTPPVADVWSNLGFALAGGSGPPQLAGQGALVPGAHVSLSLTHALPNAPLLLVAGLSAVQLPFKGGVMVPAFQAPQGLIVPLATNGAGALTLAGTWSAAVPSGTTLYAQGWLPDAGAVAGFAASNAVSATAP